MTPEEIANLKPRDRLDGIRSRDPFLQGHFYKAEVIRRTAHVVVIRTNNPEDSPDGELYSLDDSRLADAYSLGPCQPGEPAWLTRVSLLEAETGYFWREVDRRCS
jgi:hypothetical protein